MRIHRKRRALSKIRVFLKEHRGHHKVSVVVHRYLQGVQRLQKYIRKHQECTIAKILCLSKIWIKYEQKYIRMKLEKRRETLKNAKLPKSELNYDQFDAKARIEMKNQAKLWQQIDTKMEVFLTKLRFNGTITNKSDHEIIEKLLLPEHIRYDILKRIVEEMTKRFYRNQLIKARKEQEKDKVFSSNHAKDLLLGSGKDVTSLVIDKLSRKAGGIKYKPFRLFSEINQKVLIDKIRETHAKYGTFKIDIDEMIASRTNKNIDK